LREFLKSAKGKAARHQTGKDLARSSGGALDTAPVLRDFLKIPAETAVTPPNRRQRDIFLSTFLTPNLVCRKAASLEATSYMGKQRISSERAMPPRLFSNEC
jgi:hypothetical protein